MVQVKHLTPRGRQLHGVPVSKRALIARINRKLAKDSDYDMERLVITRGARAKFDLGDHYVLNQRLNFVTHNHVDPEAFARELGVLKSYERVEG